jgi:hypothetical protein
MGQPSELWNFWMRNRTVRFCTAASQQSDSSKESRTRNVCFMPIFRKQLLQIAMYWINHRLLSPWGNSGLAHIQVILVIIFGFI